LAQLNQDKTPAENSTLVLHRVYELLGEEDPFQKAKQESNRAVMKLWPKLRVLLDESGDRLFTAIKLAVAGNIIDMGILADFDIDKSVQEALEVDFALDHYAELKNRLGKARRVLVVGDNSGEIAFDRLMVGGGAGSLLFRGRIPEMKLRTQRRCSFIEEKAMAITWAGNVSPCYAGMHHYQCYIYGRKKEMHPYHFGNVGNNSLRDIWLNDEYLKFRQQVLEFQFPSCTDCKYLEGCSMVDDNLLDCWGNSPTCADCLWSRGLILCP
jgi:radical SAM protein with 4Fe4S-binding SPASM domain